MKKMMLTALFAVFALGMSAQCPKGQKCGKADTEQCCHGKAKGDCTDCKNKCGQCTDCKGCTDCPKKKECTQNCPKKKGTCPQKGKACKKACPQRAGK